MRAHKIEIRIEGLNQRLERSFKDPLGEGNPLDPGDSWRQFLVTNRATNDGDQPLVIGRLGVSNFFPARVGGAGIRADDEYEIVGLFDVRTYLRPPFLCWLDIREVNPNLPLVFAQTVPELESEISIRAGVTNACVSHGRVGQKAAAF